MKARYGDVGFKTVQMSSKDIFAVGVRKHIVSFYNVTCAAVGSVAFTKPKQSGYEEVTWQCKALSIHFVSIHMMHKV